MKLENISKIFGLLAFISFLVAIWETIASYNTGPKYSSIGATIIFILAAILTTLKRIAHDLEKKE